jgi:biopolymer transport protein ExbD
VKFLKDTEDEYSINLPSMTDIIFLLLIFFMVATVLKDATRRLDVQLPESPSGEAAETRPLTIEMAADGALSLNGEVITEEQLEERLRAVGAASNQQAVIVKADKRLAYGKVIEVMGLCQAAGLSDIAVAVK